MIDVLCGRGGGAVQHPGNKDFRDRVHSKREFYRLSNKYDKREISKSIVASIRNEGGRFLQKKAPQDNDNNNNTDDSKKVIWFEIGDNKAVAKTCQALRERIKDKTLSKYASLRRNPATSKKVNGRSKGCEGGISAATKESERKGHQDRGHLENDPHAAREGTPREPIAVLNGQSGTNTRAGSWEWKLFDFCDEDQTRQDDQLIPHEAHSSPILLKPQQQQQQEDQRHLEHVGSMYIEASYKKLVDLGVMPLTSETSMKEER